MDQHQDENNDMLLLQGALSNTLRWNRVAIECLQNNNVVKALKLFTIAFSTHERVKSKLLAKIGSAGGIRTRNNNGSIDSDSNTIGRDMGDWFVRDKSPLPFGIWEEGGEAENGTEDFRYREPIRLPLAIATAPSIVAACYNTSQLLSEESVTSAMQLLTTCHAYNLGLVNHLYGLEILRSGHDGEASFENVTATGSPISKSRIYFDRAGRLYEFTLRMERSRTKRDRNNHNSHQNKVINAPRLIIVLWCLNNLADLYQKTNQVVRCKQCYKQLRKTTERVLGLIRPGQQLCRQEDERILRSYLPDFLSRSRKGLSRLMRASDSDSDETTSEDGAVVERNSSSTRAPSSIQPPHYAFNNSCAGAA